MAKGSDTVSPDVYNFNNDLDSPLPVDLSDDKIDSVFDKRQAMVRDLSEAFGALLSSVEMMHTTTESLLHQLETYDEKLGETSSSVENVQICKRTAKLLIMTFEGIVCRQKKKAVESLAKMLYFVMHDSEEMSRDMELLLTKSLLLDNYGSLNTSVLAQEENHLKTLVKENDYLKSEVNKMKLDASMFEQKEQTFLNEKRSLTERIIPLEERLEVTERENVLRRENIIHMEKQITCLKDETCKQDKALKSKTKEHGQVLEKLKSEHRMELERKDKKISTLTEQKESLEREITEFAVKIGKLEDDLSIAAEKEIEYKKDHENMMRDLKNNRDSLEQELNLKISSLQAEMDFKEKLIESKERDIHSFQNQLKDKEKQSDSLKTKNEDLQKRVSTLEHMNDEMKKEKESVEDEIKSLKEQFDSELKEKDTYITDLKNQLDKLNKKFEMAQAKLESVLKNEKQLSNKLQSDTHSFQHTIKEKSEEIQRLKSQLNNEEKTVKELQERIKKTEQAYNKEVNNLKSEKENMKYRIGKMSARQDELQAKITHLNDELNRSREQAADDKKCYEKQIKDKDARLQQAEQLNTSSKKENWRLKEEKENLSKVCVSMEKELNVLKSKRILQVQLYSQNCTSLTSSVEDELSKLLKSKLETATLELDFIQCAKSSDVQHDLPVLLLCISVSRIGTDVANAVQGLTLSSKMAVLILHHKDVHALPSQASERVLTGHELRNLGGVFDMAFLSGRGIYECNMNKINMISLINFINREGVKKPKYQ